MKSAVETLEPTKVKLSVEVSHDELGPSLDHAYQHIAEQVQIPGFRKGKVPPRIIDQRVGRGAVLEHAINDGLPEFYRTAVTENDLHPVGQPAVEVTQVPDPQDAEGELHFTVEVEVRPAIELPDLSTVTVEVEGAEVSDEDVTASLDELRERFGTLTGVDRPAAEGDFVVLDLVATIGEEEVDSVAGVSYQIGSGAMLEGLDEALAGLSAGETTTFRSPLAGGEHAGEEADVTVTATAVKTRDLPDADDDFAQLASEFDTLDELVDDLRSQAAQARTQGQAGRAGEALVTTLLGLTDIPVPAGVVEAEVHQHLEGEGRLEDDEHRTEVTAEATDALRRQFLLDTLVEHLEVTLGQQELVDYLVNASRQYGVDPNTFIQMVQENNQIPAMVAEATRSKALAYGLRHVTVRTPDGAEVDLSEFIGSDSDDDGDEQIKVDVTEV